MKSNSNYLKMAATLAALGYSGTGPLIIDPATGKPVAPTEPVMTLEDKAALKIAVERRFRRSEQRRLNNIHVRLNQKA